MRLFLVLFLSTQVFLVSAQSSKLKVWLDPISVGLMQQRGLEMDHGLMKKDVFLINDFSASDRSWMDASGIHYDVLIEELESYYAERSALQTQVRGGRAECGVNQTSYATPDHFDLGSMGGFFTYQEFLDNLDEMASIYPSLITIKQPIDTFLTHESRPIYWVKISDNPNTNEAEPEVLYTAIHHAREPQSLSQLIFFMWYVLENYGSDAEVTNLVDNTEMFFIPMINPDGYVRNQTTNPNGGGLWRKNRRDNGDGTMGVDLNRNYGYEWAYDNQGSSPSSNSDTYRGPAAFSEPETKAVKWFSEQHSFDFALNYHSHGNYLIYPWGFIPGPLTPDSSYFIAVASHMTSQNNYVFGTGYETVAYATNGDSDDWMYGEQTAKNKIFSMTPEVGNSDDGFWPIQSRIVPLSEENVLPNLLLAHLAGMYVTMTDESPLILATTSGNIEVELKRLGLQWDANNSYSLLPVSSNITSNAASETYANMNIGQVYTAAFPYSLASSIQPGDEVVFNLVSTHTGFSDTIEIRKIFGQPTVALSNSANDTADFQTFNWGATDEEFVSPTHSITDSPYALYDNSSVTEIAYERVIDMRQSITGFVQFQAKWQVEAGWDYVQILASPLNQEAWSPLCGLYTKTGNANQDEGQPLWDGNQSNWVVERIDLNDYVGQKVKLKFRLVSDQFVNYDGFYFDDLEFITLIDPASSVPLDTGYVDSSEVAGSSEFLEGLWSVFPNPASDMIYLTSNGKKGGEMRITDLSGSMVLKQPIRANDKVDISALPAGVYVVNLVSGQAIQRQKLLIVR